MRRSVPQRTAWLHRVSTTLLLLTACVSRPSAQVIIHPADGEPVTVRVDVADTEEARQLGLMYRNELPEYSGLLFIFPGERVRSFWMKDTPLPLDIVYINAGLSIVHIVENTTPYSTAALPSHRPAKFVLELNAGFCMKHGVRIGSRIELHGVSSTLL